jgi:hypothetical protein
VSAATSSSRNRICRISSPLSHVGGRGEGGNKKKQRKEKKQSRSYRNAVAVIRRGEGARSSYLQDYKPFKDDSTLTFVYYLHGCIERTPSISECDKNKCSFSELLFTKAIPTCAINFI